MSPAQKTQIVAAGIVIVPIVTALIIWQEPANTSIAKNSFRIALSVVFAASLLRRAIWARWVVGILSVLALATWLLIFLDWDALKRVVLSWAGIWMLGMSLFYVWTTYTLLVDRTVIAYFKAKRDPDQQIIKEGEDAP
jgi:hypothetical protein